MLWDEWSGLLSASVPLLKDISGCYLYLLVNYKSVIFYRRRRLNDYFGSMTGFHCLKLLCLQQSLLLDLIEDFGKVYKSGFGLL
jgi:hypothetical protein